MGTKRIVGPAGDLFIGVHFIRIRIAISYIKKYYLCCEKIRAILRSHKGLGIAVSSYSLYAKYTLA